VYNSEKKSFSSGKKARKQLLHLWPEVCVQFVKNKFMRTFLAVILWCLLFVVCWPLALIVLFLFPLIWLILLPFRIVGLTLELVFKCVGAILLFPFRILKAL
jgi:hypothetical protein